jgi:hypothetical protein
VVRHHFLGAPLVEGETEGERVGGVARDAEELADGRDVSLAVRPVEALGDVEDEVRLNERQPRGEARVGLEAVDLAHGPQRALHRIDGGGLVPLGVEIGLGKIVAEAPTVGLVRGGGVVHGPGCWFRRRIGLEIEGESDPNCQRCPSTKKAVHERRAATS